MDLELSFLPHLLKTDSMKKIVEENVKPDFFFDSEMKRAFFFSREYYVVSGLSQAVT